MPGIRRREFITLLGGTAAWPLAARAQQAERMRLVGVLTHATPDEPDMQAQLAAFLQGLERTGWEVGRVLDRFAELRAANLDRLDELGLGSDDLTRMGRHADLGSVTLEQLLATWTVHDLNHEAQIVKTLAKRYRDAVGPWRANLGVVDLP